MQVGVCLVAEVEIQYLAHLLPQAVVAVQLGTAATINQAARAAAPVKVTLQ
jgi:hypothetical protein